MTTLDTLQGILVKEYSLEPEQVVPDASLATLGLDSLSVLELMFKVEDRFGLRIGDDTPNDLVTVADVVRYIDGLLRSRGITAAGAGTHLSA
jgi:acyl carrier protein